MLVFGLVTAIDENSARVKLSVPDMDNWETGWLFVPQTCTVKDCSYTLPEINTLAAAVCDDQMLDGCILGAVYNDEDTCILADKDAKYIVFEDGAQFMYDKITKTCTVKAENILMEGNIILEGSLAASGNISDGAGSMADIRTVYNSHNHTCPDGTTSTPSIGM